MKGKRRIIKEIFSWIIAIIGAALIYLLVNSKVFANVKVEQSSMENTLFSNQRLIIDKFSYNFRGPERGDIIIFLENEERGSLIEESLRTINGFAAIFNNKALENIDSRLVKRVIGVAGDEVDIRDGYVYINGEKLEEEYVKGETTIREFMFPVKVGEDQLFVLGDNRAVSMDSRDFGMIDIKQVEGKAMFRVYPLTQIGKIN